MPVWTYWLLGFLCLGGSAAAFATSGGEFCSAAARAAMAATPRAADTCLDYWLYRYQTLLGGVFTLLAALVGFYAVFGQTQKIEEAEQYRRVRDAQSAQAVLPLALSDICDYAQESARRLQAASRNKEGAGGCSYSPPEFPHATIDALKGCVRAKGADPLAIANLISAIQVYRSRARNLRRTLRPVERSDLMFDTIDLYARASNLFDEARSGLSDERLPKTSLQSISRVLQIKTQLFPTLARRLGLEADEEHVSDQS